MSTSNDPSVTGKNHAEFLNAVRALVAKGAKDSALAGTCGLHIAMWKVYYQYGFGWS